MTTTIDTLAICVQEHTTSAGTMQALVAVDVGSFTFNQMGMNRVQDGILASVHLDHTDYSASVLELAQALETGDYQVERSSDVVYAHLPDPSSGTISVPGSRPSQMRYVTLGSLSLGSLEGQIDTALEQNGRVRLFF